jgi:hypothetical protein
MVGKPADFAGRPAPVEERGGCLRTIGRGVNFVLKLVGFLIFLYIVLLLIA